MRLPYEPIPDRVSTRRGADAQRGPRPSDSTGRPSMRRDRTALQMRSRLCPNRLSTFQPATHVPIDDMPRFLLSPPDYYDTHFMFNPWLDYQEAVDRGAARRQWESLVDVLESLGASIEILEPNPRSSAQVFTADGALRLRGSHFLILRNDGARGDLEPERFADWLNANGYTTEQLPSRYRLDGGNIVRLNDEVVAVGLKPGAPGSGERYLKRLLRLVSDVGLVGFRLVDRQFLHLDMVLGRVGDAGYLLYDDGFESPEDIRAKLHSSERPVIRVEREDARRLVCNGVTVGDTFVTHAISQPLRTELAKLGFNVAEVDVGEFLKAGGGVRCLTLSLGEERSPP